MSTVFLTREYWGGTKPHIWTRIKVFTGGVRNLRAKIILTEDLTESRCRRNVLHVVWIRWPDKGHRLVHTNFCLNYFDAVLNLTKLLSYNIFEILALFYLSMQAWVFCLLASDILGYFLIHFSQVGLHLMFNLSGSLAGMIFDLCCINLQILNLFSRI